MSGTGGARRGRGERAALLVLLVGACARGPQGDTAGDTRAEGGTSDDDGSPDDTGAPPDSGGESGPGGDTGEGPGTPTEVDLLGPGQVNHLLPEFLGYDAARRRVYTASNLFPNVASVDLATGEAGGVFDLGTTSLDTSCVLVGAGGEVWVGYYGSPGLLRLDPSTGAVSAPPSGLRAVSVGVALAGGHVVLAGPDEEGGNRIVELDAAGVVVASTPVVVLPAALAALDDGGVVSLEATAGGTLVTRDPDGLAERSRCPNPTADPLPATSARMAALPDGSVFVSWSTAVARLVCDAAPAGTWAPVTVGTENLDVLPWEGGALVLDRLGPAGATNPLGGVLRRFDLDLTPVGDPVPTGTLAGYAAYDPPSGRVWTAAEGSGTLVGVDPDHPDAPTVVRLGVAVDLPVLSPADAGRAWYTGRLADTVGAIDLTTGAHTESHAVAWPMAPVLLDDGLWVVSQTASTLTRLDPDTLEVGATLDLGVSPSPFLTFDDLAVAPGRGTLLYSVASDNLLLEVDPSTGAEVGRWALAGPPLSNWQAIGRLEVVPLGGDVVVVVRTTDGWMTRVDLATGEVTRAELPSTGWDREAIVLDLVTAGADGTFFVGGLQVDGATLVPTSGVPFSWTRLLAPLADGHFLAWLADTGEVAVTDAEGAPLATVTLGADAAEDPHFVWDASRERLVYTRVERAGLVTVDVAPLLRAAGL